MTVFGVLLRLYSYVFNLILCLFLLGVGLVASASHTVPKLGMLPFTDENMNLGIVTLAVVGLVCTLLAATGIFRYLFPIWTAIVLLLMLKGFIFSHYTFSGEAPFRTALWLTFGALVAFIGGLWVLKPKRLTA